MLSAAKSLLYVPGDRPDRFEKALASGADVVIIDLEDSVAPDRKPLARAATAEWLRAHPGQPVAVRVDRRGLEADLEAIHGLTGAVVLPSADEAALDELAALAEGWGAKPEVMALVETALGVATVDLVSAHPWVTRLGMGETDLAADLSIMVDEDRTELFPYRAAVVLHSRVNGLPWPVGSTSTMVDNASMLQLTSEQLRRQGFGGRTAIHPRQVPVINDAFSPTGEELERARQTLAEYRASRDAGQGAFAGRDGRMVDAATVRWAEELLGEDQV